MKKREKPFSKGELCALVFSFSLLGTILCYAVFIHPQDPILNMDFTVKESLQFRLDQGNFTRITFTNGNGFTFQGLYNFTEGKTYHVNYLPITHGKEDPKRDNPVIVDYMEVIK